MASIEEKLDNSDKPFIWKDTLGNNYRYYADPLRKVCSFILIHEVFERLAFYGVQNNIKKLLREQYGMSEPACNSFALAGNGLVYCSSLISAILSDSFMGPYNTIVVFSLVYMAGLILVLISAIPGADALWMVYFSQFGLFALGAGGIKSCVSVLGGQQYSPIHQKVQLASFFTYFYGSINVGALIGGIIIPILIQNTDIGYGFILPVASFTVATVAIMLGSKRYVKVKPQGSAVVQIAKVVWQSVGRLSLSKCKKSQGGIFDDQFIDDAKVFFSLVPIFALAIPFHNSYVQTFTLFETQSEAMDGNTFGWDMPAQMMTNMDPIAVILGAYVLESWIYPYLRSKNLYPSVMQRFVIGYILAALSNVCALLVQIAIQDSAAKSVSMWTQTAQIALVAWGELFVVSTTYEVAYTYSPEPLKAVSSAFNLTAIAIASYLKIGMIQACKPWMDSNRYDYLYYMMTGICLLFAIISYLCNSHCESVFARAELHNKTATSVSAKITDDEKSFDQVDINYE